MLFLKTDSIQTLPYTLLLFFAFNVNLLAQNAQRQFESAKEEENRLIIHTKDGHYRIQAYNQNIIETSFIPKNEKFIAKSHAVILKPNAKSKIRHKKKEIIYKTGDFVVRIQKQPFQIAYYYDDDLLVSEKKGYHKTDSTEQIQFNLESKEILYGGGARALGMNRRGKRLQLYNRAHYGYENYSELMNYTAPIVLSNKKYLLHFDNAPIGFLDLDHKQNNTLTYETISGRKTYQIVAAKNWQEINYNYAKLTGFQPLLPRWALGNFSSRFGYHSQKEVLATINKFKKEKIPVDAVILDLFWFGKEIKGTMGNLKADKDSFPDLPGMIAQLKKQDVKTILITEPFIVNTSNRWQEAIKEDILAKDSVGKPAEYEFYFGNTGIIDIYNSKAKHWFWNIYKDLAQQGAAGFWGDLGEPEVHPNWVQHQNAMANQVHNIYGHDWAKLIATGYQRDFPNTRAFILMRAGYSGSQRFGMIPWSGDVSRSWGGLKPQPEISLQMGMQGLAYMHSDLGGFAGANLDDELYARWLQYGVFNPIFRPHAQEDVPSEPVFRSAKAKQLAKQAIELRYKMLPYNANLVYENHTKGLPLMRPLFYDEPNNPELYLLSNNYLWGNDFLIAPVVKMNQKKVEVYFPKSANWFDFYNNEIYKGGKSFFVKTKEESIPTFVRGGSIVPLARDLENTTEYQAKELEIHWFVDDAAKKTNRQFYHDDGIGTKTKDSFFNFKGKTKSNKLILQLKQPKTLQQKIQTKLVLRNISKKPNWVKAGKEKIQFVYDAKIKQVHCYLTWKGNQTITIKR